MSASIVKWIVVIFLILLSAFTLALWLGGPKAPPPLASISAPFKNLDYSAMPASQRYRARDGAQLAYRHYVANGTARGSVVLVHGSSARSNSLHPLAMSLAQAGWQVDALDMRGHGESGVKGDIAYIGQLEDDIEDFMKQAALPGSKTLIGFSSGGGFVLRFAADARQAVFDRYVLLSPMLHQDAPTARPNNGGWVSVGIPRYVAIMLLNRLGISAFNHLPVIAFALNDKGREFLTESYSYTLASNFRPHNDYAADIRNAKQPMQLLVGKEDELFIAEQFEPVMRAQGSQVPVTIVPGANHMGMTLNHAAIDAIATALAK